MIAGVDYLSNLKERRNKQKALMMFKIANGMTPRYLKDTGASVYNLRTSQDDTTIPRARTDYYRKSFAFTEAKIWNALPNDTKEQTEISESQFWYLN